MGSLPPPCRSSSSRFSTVTLPAIPLHTVLTVAAEKYAMETTKQREQVREIETEQDLAGIYVYRSYLKRLRRLHRNYVKKCNAVLLQEEQQQQLKKQQQQDLKHQQQQQLKQRHLSQQQQQQQLKHQQQQHLKHQQQLQLKHQQQLQLKHQQQQQLKQRQHRLQQFQESPRNSLQPKITRFGDDCLPAKTSFRLSRNSYPQNSSHPSDQVPGPRGSVTVASTARQILDAKDDEYDEKAELGSRRRPIYIPCGREPNPSFMQQQQQQQQGSTKKETEKSNQPGTLNFHMWRHLCHRHRTMYSS